MDSISCHPPVRILFFTRGRGRGHAIPDIQLASQLPADWDIRFASYGTGAATFASAGIPCIDMGLPDTNGTAETTVIAGRLIGHLNPDIVVVHEEFAALPAAKIFGKPTILITDFFTSPEMYSMATLSFADAILFPGRRGVFTEPPQAKGRVTYVQPILRPFAYRRNHRRKARAELGLDEDTLVISVLPGSWTEQMAPSVDQIHRAFTNLKAPAKHLIWLAGSDQQAIHKQIAKNATILSYTPEIDRIMAASDLAITKCNRLTVTELASLGIRTISMSYGLNPTDEQAIASLPANRTVTRLTHRILADALATPEPRPVRWPGETCSAILERVVSRLSSMTQRG
jgi:hypothetical protein